MKKLLEIGKKIGKSVLLGVADSVPVVSNIKANISNELGGKGKVDWVRLGVAICTVIIIICVLLGKITIDQAKELLKAI